MAADTNRRAERGLPIAAVSELLAIPVPTIRSWERRYGYPAPARTAGRHRRYSTVEVEQLRALRDAITQGHAARDAVALVERAANGAPARDPAIDAILKAAMDLDPEGVRSVLDRVGASVGVENAVGEVVLPAMHEVGTRWKAGICDAANEHLLTGSVRRWLARQTTFAPPAFQPGPVVLACGPKELHSVGLEAFGAVLVGRGWPVIVLGAMTPVDSLRKAVLESRAHAAVVVAQRAVNRRSTSEALDAIEPLLGGRAFYAGGAFLTPSSRRDVSGTYLGTDILVAAAAIDATGRA